VSSRVGLDEVENNKIPDPKGNGALSFNPLQSLQCMSYPNSYLYTIIENILKCPVETVDHEN